MSRLSILSLNCLLDSDVSLVFIDHILQSQMFFDQKEGSDSAPSHMLLGRDPAHMPALADVQ